MGKRKGSPYRIRSVPPTVSTVSGPYSTIVAAAAIGPEDLKALAHHRAIMWSDVDLRSYYGPVDLTMVKVEQAGAYRYDPGGVQAWFRNGHVAVGTVDNRSWVVRDSVRRYMYYSRSRVAAYTIALKIIAAHAEGEETTLDSGLRLQTPQIAEDGAKSTIVDEAMERVYEMESLTGGVAAVPMTTAEAWVLRSGGTVPLDLLRRVASSFPHMAVKVFGFPLICVDVASRRFASRISLRSAFDWAGADWTADLHGWREKDGDLYFGSKLRVIGGWAKESYREALCRHPSEAAALSLAMDIAPVPYLPASS